MGRREKEGKMRRGSIVLVSIYPPKERFVKPVEGLQLV